MAPNKELLSALKKNTEVELSVKGRVSGKDLPRPVWFALSKDAESILLIPINGRKTQWYLNVRKEPNVTIRVGGQSFTGKVKEMGSGEFKRVLALFDARYGTKDMRDYYPKLEVALQVSLPT